MRSAERPFSAAVQRCFARRAATYQQGARLQAAVAQRLAGLSARLWPALPDGPRADLGAGSGLLARAIEARLGGDPLLRLDLCPNLLAQESGDPSQRPQLQWDLNGGLPPALQGASLLASSFALQWLDQPSQQLEHWCRSLQPGGCLLLALPTAGSFGIWRRSAQQAGVPFTGLELPSAEALLQVARRELQLSHQQRLQFSRPNPGGRAFLQQIKAIGAHASRSPRLSPAQLRRLLQHWPQANAAPAILWEVLLVVGLRP